MTQPNFNDLKRNPQLRRPYSSRHKNKGNKHGGFDKDAGQKHISKYIDQNNHKNYVLMVNKEKTY